MTPKRRSLSLTEKNEVLSAYEALPKCSQRAAALKLGVSQPLLCKLLKAGKLCDLDESGNGNLHRKRKRYGKCESVDKALLNRVNSMISQNASLSRSTIRQQAKEVARELGEKDFIPTDGWLSRWIKRHNVAYGKICLKTKAEQPGPSAHEIVDKTLVTTPQECTNDIMPVFEWAQGVDEEHYIDTASESTILNNLEDVKSNITKITIHASCDDNASDEHDSDDQVSDGHQIILPSNREIRKSLETVRMALELKEGQVDDFKLFYKLQQRVESLIAKDLKQQKLQKSMIN